MVGDVANHVGHQHVSSLLTRPTARAPVAAGVVLIVMTDVVLTDVVLLESQCRDSENGIEGEGCESLESKAGVRYVQRGRQHHRRR